MKGVFVGIQAPREELTVAIYKNDLLKNIYMSTFWGDIDFYWYCRSAASQDMIDHSLQNRMLWDSKTHGFMNLIEALMPVEPVWTMDDIKDEDNG